MHTRTALQGTSSAEQWLCTACRRQQSITSTRQSSHLARALPARRSRFRGPQLVNNVFSAISRRHSSSAHPVRNASLPETPVRTRFAPSPTGYLHIGGLRTALFSYLLAKRTKGQFLLRLEDTDQKRLVPDAEQQIYHDLRWAGLQWDEGPEVEGPHAPYKQSQRLHIYQKYASHLLDSGSAYRCFCTPQTAALSGSAATFVTSGCYQDCASLSPEESHHRAIDTHQPQPFTVRLKVPADAHRRVYKDLIYGKIQRLKRSPGASVSGDAESGAEAADTILIKSDGVPTYHFANVVDDHEMQITHVIRGSEWMASTPLHYDLYAAFGWTPPQFAHVGLLVDEKKAKLSKRGDSGLVLDVRGMRGQQHVLPSVLCNFLALLGWSNPGRNDVMEMQELIDAFDLKFTKGNTVVRMEKLWFLQKAHVTRMCREASSDPAQDSAVDDLVGQIFPSALDLCAAAGGTALFQIADAPSRAALLTHCKRVLLVDSKAYQQPASYIDRNSYFFTFDISETPPDAEFYDKQQKLSASDLRSMTNDLIAGESFQTAFDGLSASHAGDAASADAAHLPRASNLLRPIEQVAKEIHHRINSAVWRNVLPDSEHPSSIDDPAAYAQQLASQQSSTDGSAQTLLRDFKNGNAALLRYLRDRLSYGRPGPGMGHVMAVLGWHECVRRLTMQPRSQTLQEQAAQ